MLDSTGKVTSTQTFATGFSGPVYLTKGPDGNLYYVEIGLQQVKRIRYVGNGNEPPVAKAAANPTYGMAPLTVNFSSAGTSDPDGDTLTYSWNFGDGSSSTSANPIHQYSANGKYSVVLTVKDPSGATDTASALITVGSTPPKATINTPPNGEVVDVNSTVNYSGSAFDAEDGNLTGSSLVWTVIIHHNNTHTHDYFQATGSSGSFVMPAHDTTSDFYLELKLTATDSSGLTDSQSVNIYPNLPASGCAQPGTATAVVICTPTAGSTTTSPVHVTAAGGSSVTLMELWADGKKLGQWSGHTIDTSPALANGPHKLTVFGKNSAGVLSSAVVNFTVGSSGGGCTPSSSTAVVICTPTDGSTQSSPFHVSAVAGSTSNFMELWFDGTKVFQNAGNSISTDVTAAAGSHKLTVYGRNSSGVVGSTQITVTIGSGGSTCAAPSSAGINICSPAADSTVSSPVHAWASATVNGTYSRMELWVDGVKKFQTTSHTLDATIALGSGKHRFAFLAINTAGTVINKAVYATIP